MKSFRNALMLGACTLLPAAAIAQTSGAASGTPSATPNQAATAPATTGGAAATTSSTAAPANGAAASTASITTGAKVLDTAGGTAGTIESVDGDYVVLATGKSKVRLPKTSFAIGPNGPVIAMTAAQLDAAAAQAAPAAAATTTAKPDVAQGAAVSDTQGGAVGTVASVEGSIATVTLANGGKVRLPVSAFAAGTGGGLKIAMTAAQLKAAAAAK